MHLGFGERGRALGRDVEHDVRPHVREQFFDALAVRYVRVPVLGAWLRWPTVADAATDTDQACRAPGGELPQQGRPNAPGPAGDDDCPAA